MNQRQEDDIVTELINSLARPLHVWRMARGLLSNQPWTLKPSQEKSARTRVSNANKEIIAIVLAWTDKHRDVLEEM